MSGGNSRGGGGDYSSRYDDAPPRRDYDSMGPSRSRFY